MLKRLFQFLLIPSLVLFLTGCFGLNSNSEDAEVRTLVHTYTDEQNRFEIKYPDTFLQVPEQDLPSGALMALVDLTASQFTTNITVSSENLTEAASSLRFALANIRKSEKVLPGYIEREVSQIKIGDKETRLHLFTLDRDGQQTNFTQLYLTDRDEGYVVTATYPADISEQEEGVLLNMIKSFKLLVSD